VILLARGHGAGAPVVLTFWATNGRHGCIRNSEGVVDGLKLFLYSLLKTDIHLD